MRINTSKTKEMVMCFCRDRTYVESLSYIDINGTASEANIFGLIFHLI